MDLGLDFIRTCDKNKSNIFSVSFKPYNFKESADSENVTKMSRTNKIIGNNEIVL